MSELSLYIVAGEESGDILGAQLMADLKAIGPVQFHGVGGSRMFAQGLKSVFPMSDLSVMGITNVVRHLPTLMKRKKQLVQDIHRVSPSLMVTIDSPDFMLRLARSCDGLGIPLVHYVAPTVWAWRPSRVHSFKRVFDHILSIFPFEPPYFERVGLPCTFVGHPVMRSHPFSSVSLRTLYGLSPDSFLLCVLPGSRLSEAKNLIDIFRKAACLVHKVHPDLVVVVPTTPPLASMVSEHLATWPMRTLLIKDEEEKKAAFSESTLALAASGTVALELAHAGCPAVIAYRLESFIHFEWLVRHMMRVRFAYVSNILLEREVVPEFLGRDCHPQALASALLHLLDKDPKTGETYGKQQIQVLQPVLQQLSAPSKAKAAEVLYHLAK